TLRFDGDRPGEVALRHRGRHFGDCAHLVREVCRELIDVVGEISPRAVRAGHVCLSSELAFDADLARDRSHLVGEGGQRVGHSVDRACKLCDLALGFNGQLSIQVSICHCGHHPCDAAHLPGKVAGHEVDVVGQVFPGSGDALHVCLTAQLTLRADFARHACDLGREGIELVHHDVDRVLELEYLSLHVNGDLLGEVAVCNCGSDFGDVADLCSQVAGHEVYVVGQVLPRTTNPSDVRLASQLAFGTDLAGHASDFGSKRVELIDHSVDY